jgi:hypothetical protein
MRGCLVYDLQCLLRTRRFTTGGGGIPSPPSEGSGNGSGSNKTAFVTSGDTAPGNRFVYVTNGNMVYLDFIIHWVRSLEVHGWDNCRSSCVRKRL